MRRIWNEILTTLALCFLVAFSYPAFNEDISPSIKTLIEAVQWIGWLAFAVDLVYGIWTADNKKNY